MSTISAGTTSTTTLIHSGDTTGSLVLKTNDTGSGGTTAVTIDASQNVGIGTSSPSARLNIVDATSQDALRITQTGTGNALVVEDSANPDSTPFVVDASGRVIRGATSSISTTYLANPYIQNTSANAARESSVGLISWVNAAASCPVLEFAHSRSGTVGTQTLSTLDDTLGQILFEGDDGTAFIRAASITASIDGTPGTNDMPGRLVFSTTADGASSPTERMRIDSSGNVGIGTSSPARKLVVASSAAMKLATAQGALFSDTANDGGVIIGSDFAIGSIQATNAAGTSAKNLMLQAEGGNLLVGTTTSGGKQTVTQSTDAVTAQFNNSAGSLSATIPGIQVSYGGAIPNNTSQSFLYVGDYSALRAQIRSNGGLANYSANNVNLSDRREKTNFAPAKSYLDVICAIPVQTFNYIDQNLEEDDGLTLGVIAQDVQAVAPELVSESNWGTEEEPKIRLSIYQTDLQYALMKCIQEQQALIQQLQADVAALKGTS